MRTETADIEFFVFTSLYPEEWEKSVEMVPTVSEGDTGGGIPALPSTPENIQYARSGVGCHRNIKGVAGNDVGGCFFHPTPMSLAGAKGGGIGSSRSQRT